MNIPNITEHKAIKLFDEKFGRDKTTRFLKVREEFREMSEAFSEYLETGDDEHLCDEICDLQATVTHLASLFGMYQKKMLHTSVDKIIKRETDPGYKRFPNVRSIKSVGVIGNSINSDSGFLRYVSSQNFKAVITGVTCSDFTESKEAAISVLEKINHLVIENRKLEIPLISADIECKNDFKEKEPKPWDRNEINRHSKPSYKNKRRKK